MSSEFDLVQVQSTWEIVADRLRAAILAGELTAGRKLVETDIAGRFGVSRGPVREALRELAREGLVADLPRRGTVVCTITQADLMEVYAVREALEVQAVRESLGIATDAEICEVSRAYDLMIEAWQGEDWNAAVKADKAFHQSIVQLAKNKRLSTMYEQMAHQTLLLLVTASKTDRSLTAAPLGKIHQEMADAVMAQDLTAATEAIRRHYQYTRKRLFSSFD
ncbi:GntR family transcriptional regulator [Tenggerimyces flavus]|uniref:GntR family transcriptional regulator n=1 Tax=Tenggerimyces flavus TaxID=1708749 RepID=A0ABV7YJ89_9ACTN|nr:GntR family transcriptional regulator [Tenggerimyces flavus]MBM7789618.1 DNA-binding GntR family transcriptional regulator [Tenggerimyces flavus]